MPLNIVRYVLESTKQILYSSSIRLIVFNRKYYGISISYQLKRERKKL